MQTLRAYSLAFSTLFLLACGDSGGELTAGDPGLLTGPCIQGQCLAGLQCFVDKCLPDGGGGNSNSNSNSNSDGEPEDPTGTSSSTGGDDTTTGNVTTQGSNTTPPTATTEDDPVTSTGDPPNPSTTTNDNTTGVDRTTDPPDTTDDTFTSEDSDDSQGFIRPPDGECGFDVCEANETCVDVGEEPTCLVHCDPLNQAFCGADNVCVPQGAELFLCAPDASGDTGMVGQGCAYSNGCDPGNLCLNGPAVAGCNGQACCSAFCDLDLADICVQYGMQCVAWFEMGQAPAGFEDVGACVLP